MLPRIGFVDSIWGLLAYSLPARWWLILGVLVAVSNAKVFKDYKVKFWGIIVDLPNKVRLGTVVAILWPIDYIMFSLGLYNNCIA